MKYFKLIDCPHNRRHYGSLIGRIFRIGEGYRAPLFAVLIEV